MAIWGYPSAEMATVGLAFWQWRYRDVTSVWASSRRQRQIRPEDRHDYDLFKKALGYYKDARYESVRHGFVSNLKEAANSFQPNHNLAVPDNACPKALIEFLNSRDQNTLFLDPRNYPGATSSGGRNLKKRIWLTFAECAVALNCDVHLSESTRASEADPAPEPPDFVRPGDLQPPAPESAISNILSLNIQAYNTGIRDSWPKKRSPEANNLVKEVASVFNDLLLYEHLFEGLDQLNPVRDLAVILKGVRSDHLRGQDVEKLIKMAQDTWYERISTRTVQVRSVPALPNNPLPEDEDFTAVYADLAEDRSIIEGAPDNNANSALARATGTTPEEKLLNLLEACKSKKSRKHLQQNLAQLMQLMAYVQYQGENSDHVTLQKMLDNSNNLCDAINQKSRTKADAARDAADSAGDLVTNDLIDIANALFTYFHGDPNTGELQNFSDYDTHLGAHLTISNWAGAPGLIMTLYSFGRIVTSWRQQSNWNRLTTIATFLSSGTYRGAQFTAFVAAPFWKKSISDSAKTVGHNCTCWAAVAGIVTGTLGVGLSLKEGIGLQRVGRRWNYIKKDRELIHSGFSENKIYGTFEKCVRRIARRKYRTALDGTASATSIGTSVIALVGTVGTLGLAATPIGWILFGAGLCIGVGLLGYKTKRRSGKREKWRRHQSEIAGRGLPRAPFWCKTTGDYYRFVVALFIFDASLDVLPTDSMNRAGKIMAWVLFGGKDEGAAAAEATQLGVQGILGYIKG